MTLTSRSLARLAAPLVAGAITLCVAPRSAEACGGTFCDGGPQLMPVDQTGENILFVYNAETIEAHIQIQYEGEAENFAWVIPVTAIPEIGVGSQALFNNLLASTAPQYGTLGVPGPCRGDGPGLCGGPLGDLTLQGGLNEAAPNDGGAGETDGDPDIAARGVAGAFEYAVLEGGTVQGVVDWLTDNGYAQDDDAPPILGEYLDDGYLFVAVKLRSGADVNEIQPLVLEYAGSEPCIPIKLTRIAAVDDMGIRAFFLGVERTFSTNFAHAELNLAKLDWINFGDNYGEVVTMAVDEEPDGLAFVTEYAGDSNIVSQDGILGPQWSAPRFINLSPHEVVDELSMQGLANCTENTCEFLHPLVEGLLATYVPLPTGAGAPEAGPFYSCLSCYLDQIDQAAWDGQSFADEFAERIVQPAVDAIELLGRKPYLTTLFTTLSPHEMTRDPMFHQNGDVGDVSNLWVATQVFACEGNDWLELPDGTVVHLDEDGNMPTLDDAPAAVSLATVPENGAPMINADNTEAIASAIEAWNADNPVEGTGGGSCTVSGRRDAEGPLALLAIFGFATAGRRRRR
jgi:hypothetical protein